MVEIVDDREMRIDEGSVSGGYFKHAVYNHWDPYEDIEASLIDADRQTLIEREITEQAFNDLSQAIALFGAGEESVTEDLAPMMIAFDDINDEMFISSQIYDEAKHTQFFERYWREVLHPTADELGYDRRYPTEEVFFPDDYIELFDRTEAAMERLLTDDTPENRVKAYCHYHLGIESVLAQTGYYGFTSVFSDKGSDRIAANEGWTADGGTLGNLDGLVKGISFIRQDEGRHVGFGMQKVQGHLRDDGVDDAVVNATLTELLPLIATTVSATENVINSEPIIEYASDKLSRRIDTMTDYEAEIPAVDELVALGDESVAAD